MDTPERPPRPHRPTYAYLCASLHTGSGPEVWAGVQEAAEALDVNVLAFPGGRLGGRDDFESLRNRVFSLPGPGCVDGVLSWASSLSGVRDAGALAALHDRFAGLPLVTLSDVLPGRPCVRFDVRTGMSALVDHLVLVHGYRDFAFVRGPVSHGSAQERYGAFVDSLRRHGLAVREELVTTPRGWDQGREALAELLDTRGRVPGRDFSVIIAASDMLGFSILRGLQNRGYRVPADTAVTGFNDSAESRFANPSLTTVHLPFRRQAVEGLEQLHALWKGTPPGTGDHRLETRLVLRQSCACRSRELERAGSAAGPLAYADLGFTPSEIRDWLGPLEASLDEPVPERRERRFFDLLDRVLDRVSSQRFPVSTWQTVLSELRRSRPVLDRGLEDLFGRARVLVSEASVREASFRQWQREQKSEQLRALSRALQGALDPRRLSEVLTRRLPDLGFRCAFLVRQDGPGEQPRARLLGGFTEHGPAELPPGGLDFPVLRLLPPGFLPDRRRTLVVEPLYYRDHSLGYLALESPEAAAEVFEELRDSVSVSLKTALLLDPGDSSAADLRFFDPLVRFPDLGSAVLPLGSDRLPLCVADPRPLSLALEESDPAADPARVVLDGPALRVELTGGRSFLLPFPTLGGEPASLEGDMVVLLSESVADEGFLRRLEEASALSAQVFDPRSLRFEVFAALRPALCAVDLDTAGEATLRMLTLLGSDPGWKTVPFLVLPTRGRVLVPGQDRGLLDHLRGARTGEGGLKILFVGLPPPGGDHPGLEFQVVSSAIQAVPYLQQERPDLVVTASGGLGFRGLDLVDFLRSDPPLATVPILVLADADLRPEDWARLDGPPLVTVQVQGLWTDAELIRSLGAFSRRSSEPSPRVVRALAWLTRHHSQDISRWKLAEALSISEDHLTREFRKELGLSPWEFLARYRVLRARKILESGTLGLTEVGRAVGYHDTSYFCRVFRKWTGTSPQKYRETRNRPE